MIEYGQLTSTRLASTLLMYLEQPHQIIANVTDTLSWVLRTWECGAASLVSGPIGLHSLVWLEAEPRARVKLT